MTPMAITLAILGFCLFAVLAVGVRAVRRRNAHLWLPGYLRQSVRRGSRPRSGPSNPIHVILCIADHFEPEWGGASDRVADERVAAWIEKYPQLFGGLRDSDGRCPRHTFFYPIDQYQPRHVGSLAELCRGGFGEVEIHLHHDHDTAANLERTLRGFTEELSHRHGLLGAWPDGRPAYGFVHGNWALDNSRPDGRWCGVDNELEVLRRTGCYADFTLPSAPDATQTRTVNSIYYASGCDGRRKSHDRGVAAGNSHPPPNSLMLIQGPLGLWWKRPWRPAVENGCLQLSQPPSVRRLESWLRARVQVASRPDWYFVKLHTHGATESNQRVILDRPMVQFHESLAAIAARGSGFHYHYVTAREMFNLARAAESGSKGRVADLLDFEVGPPNRHRAPRKFEQFVKSATPALESRR